MFKISKAIPVIAAAAVAATVAVAVPASAGPSQASASTATSSTVRDYNDGFTDAKRDDCRQGFAPACAWLHHRLPRNAWPSWVRHSVSRDGSIVVVWPAGFGTSCQMRRHGPVETT